MKKLENSNYESSEFIMGNSKYNQLGNNEQLNKQKDLIMLGV